MYEMKGALSGHSPGSAGFPASRLRVSQSPGLTVPDRLVSEPHRPRSTGFPTSLVRFVRSPGLPGATRRPPVPGTRCKFRFPGLYIAPGETPGWCPFPAVKTFLRPQPASRKSPSRFILSFFPVHILSTEFRRLSARRSGYPLPYAQLLHRSPGVTQGIPAMTAHRNHSVFSRRPSVNPEFRPALPRPRPPRRPNAMDQHFHCVRTYWIRGAGTGTAECPENTMARFPASVYHRHMTSCQAPKRPGCMNPVPRLSAALAGGVVAW